MTQMIRTSERRQFKRCPQQWWWAWVEGLATKEPSKALWFGTGWHLVMADYYRKGTRRSKDYIDLWREYCNTPDAEGLFMPVDEMGEEWVDLRTLGEEMLQNYVATYRGDRDWDVIQTEYSGEVRIPKLNGDGHITYCFTFDGVYREKSSKRIKLMEHKTAASISIRHLSLDDQGGSYWLVAPTILRHNGVLSAKEKVWGITYNFARKGRPSVKPRDSDGYITNKPQKKHFVEALTDAGVPLVKIRGTLAALEELADEHGVVVLGERSKVQDAPLLLRHDLRRTPKERLTQKERIQAEAVHMEDMQTGAKPVYKSPGDHCSWCAFFDLCEMQEQRADTEEFKRAVYLQVDRYDAHRDRKVA